MPFNHNNLKATTVITIGCMGGCSIIGYSGCPPDVANTMARLDDSCNSGCNNDLRDSGMDALGGQHWDFPPLW